LNTRNFEVLNPERSEGRGGMTSVSKGNNVCTS